MKLTLLKRTLALFAIFMLFYPDLQSQSPTTPLPSPYSWKDKDNVILVMQKDRERLFFEYNIKSELMKEVDLSKDPVTDPYVVMRDGDIFLIYPDKSERRLTSDKSVEKNPTLSPDFKNVAFTRDNDLYSVNVDNGIETRYTYDGSDLILNGRASWVYFEEIFGRAGQYRAFWWSPDGQRLAFYRFDDSRIPMFPIYDASGQYGSINETRYPKAGESNPGVKLGFVSVNGGKIQWADFEDNEDQYFGTPYWNSNGANIMVQWMDRDQSNFVLYDVNSYDGTKRPIYTEYQKTWIDWINDIKFGKNGFYFVRDFELWEHIYFQSYDGKTLERLTNGMNWGIRIIDLDEKNSSIHFSARRETSLRTDIYKLSWSNKGKEIKRVSSGEFNYTMPILSPDKKNIVAISSNVTTPPRLVLLSSERRAAVKEGEYRIISDSKSEEFDLAALSLPKFISVTTPEGYTLPGTIVYPANFDKSKKYPVIFYIYGGPNSTYVMDTWRSQNRIGKLMSEEGIIQVSVDNRASGHFGKEGINYIHRNLGHYELIDYIQWAKYLKSLQFVDAEKIGIIGFSYGGTMTMLALTEGHEHFKYGVAGAGVYDWLLYDTHYTERYMDHPENNEEGYAKSAAINKAALYKSEQGSRVLITHGIADDNVHLQNSIQMIEALQKEGKQFDLMLYPGSLHGYRGYQGLHSEELILSFWRKYLLNK